MMMSPVRKWAMSIQPPVGGAVKVEMKRLSPPSTDRFRPFITPPWVLAWSWMPADIAIIAPDSALSTSLGSRVTRATAKDGL